eukprot:m.876722 g.876722  ORF g.876722 m.876722 type:complete len:433 (+) comp23580_c0_seq19:71-1369(+)
MCTAMRWNDSTHTFFAAHRFRTLSLYRNICRTYTNALNAPLDVSFNRVPVTVITGFLGSGKTTLLNYILRSQHHKRIAVIQNEFGDIGIDDILVQDKFKVDEDIFATTNGCLCCMVRKDLIDTVSRLFANTAKHAIDRIVVETSGMADPSPIIQTFLEPPLASFTEIDGVVTMVDAEYGLQHLEETRPPDTVNEAVEQVLYADRIVINKTDLLPVGVHDQRYTLLRRKIHALNPRAEIVGLTLNNVSTSCASTLDVLLDVGGFDLDVIGRMLAAERHSFIDNPTRSDGGQKGEHQTAHDDALPCATVQHEHAPLHTQHDVDIGATSLVIPGVMSAQKLEQWIKSLLDNQGANIYRMKGVCAVAAQHGTATSRDTAADDVFHLVYQAVHMRFQSDVLTNYRGDADNGQSSRVVLIGRGVNADDVRAGFESCVI